MSELTTSEEFKGWSGRMFITIEIDYDDKDDFYRSRDMFFDAVGQIPYKLGGKKVTMSFRDEQNRKKKIVTPKDKEEIV